MSIQKNSLHAWLLATRPKTLTAALTPVVTASALAFSHGTFRWKPALLCILFATFMQIAANFINDLYDFLRGTDGADRLGPERACAKGWISPSAMKAGILAVLLPAGAAGISLLAYGGSGLWFIGIACVAFAFLYTVLLSYCGLGDILVWVFFGFIPVCGTYYVQAGTLPAEVWWLGAACGLCIDTLLVLNNYRDRETDATAGKRTLIVVLGEPFGRWFYLLQGAAAYVCVAMTALQGHTWAAIFPLFYLLPHYLTWRKMAAIFRGRELNKVLGFTSRNMLTFALLIVLAYLADIWGA